MTTTTVNATRDDVLRLAFCDVVRTIALALDMDEEGKLNHASRVALISYHTAQALDVPEPGPLFYAGLLHDLGGIGLEDHVVHQLGRGVLTDEVRGHALRGARMVRPFAVLRPYEEIIEDHHERIDGRGFPSGKRGDQISLGASIVHLADVIDLTIRAESPSTVASAVAQRLELERGSSVPEVVAGATLEVLLGRGRLLPQLVDDSALEAATAALCPSAPELARTTRWELLSQLLWVLARVIDGKHSNTMGHSARVAHLAYRIAIAFSDDVNAWDVAWAGLLHDVGMIGVPRHIVEKAPPLGDAERTVVEGHARDTGRIIATIRDLAYLAVPASSHHERYDGTGYPEGLAAEGIPLVGRILAYADTYDTLASPRPGRPALGHCAALTRLRAEVGKALDPGLADAAFAALQRWGAASTAEIAAPFSGFFERDDADLDAAFGREAGSGTPLRALPRGALLAHLAPWTSIHLEPTASSPPDEAQLRAVVRLQDGTDPSGSSLDADSMLSLKTSLERLPPGDSVAQYLFTEGGVPFETVLGSWGSQVTLLCRSAEGRLQSLGRLARFYRNFLASAEAVVFADPEGRIVDVNEAFLRLFGYDRGEVVGQSTRLLHSGHQSEGFYRELWSALNDPATGSWSGELIDRKRNGEEIPVRMSIESVRDPNGTAVGYLAHIVDISERTRMEAELRSRQVELSRANEELVRLGRFKDDLISMTSHDLRGPLGAIVNMTDLMIQELPRLPQARVAGFLGRIRDTASRLSDLVNDLLDLEKTESGAFQLLPCRVYLDPLARQCVERVRAASRRQVDFEVSAESPSLSTVADPTRLEQVLVNLLGNAAKFTPEGSTVRVRLRRDVERDHLVLDVEDEGPGIPEEARISIFDRFYQARAGKAVSTRGFGTGLGLNIVKNLVELHGGSVHAENRPSGGCLFRVALPARTGDARLTRPVAVVLARFAPHIEELVHALREQGVEALWIETAGRLVSDCELTRAEIVLYDDAIADTDVRRFLEGRGRDPAAGPMPVRLLADGEPYPDLDERVLSTPALPSELRELVNDALQRQRAEKASP